MKMKRALFFLVMHLLFGTLGAQVVSTDKPFPTADEPLTLTFDAAQGNRGLEDCNCDVYLHTGLITSQSTSPSDWRYVQGEWGIEIPRLKMTSIGDNKYTYDFTIRDFYEVPESEEILQLAFVFRNVNGSLAGRATGGGDIFLDVFSADAGLNTAFVRPAEELVFIRPGETILIEASVSENAQLRLEENGAVIFTGSGLATELRYEYTPVHEQGRFRVDFIAEAGNASDTASFSYLLLPTGNRAELPVSVQPGLNRHDDGSATFVLEAPGKEFAFLLTDRSDFEPATDFLMNQTPDGNSFWITLNGLDDPAAWHAYQYLVDGEIYIADPYSELILDPANDPFVDLASWPEPLPDYPEQGKGNVSVFKMEGFPYEWRHNDFTPPATADLVVYELLMRDFLASHHYRDLIDTLDYLQRLGVNAVELMPVNEFEGNDSWGYNPSFHMALDKYYGDPVTFKRFVDEAHARGIAVILDVVYNHAFSQSPLAQLYWDPTAFRPTEENPWLNVIARHPFNVGYDFNHESTWTRRFVDQVIAFWLEEYRIDGFRFDLSKGFSQVDYGDDVGRWSGYDASRIAILKHYAETVWSANPLAYVIMEHFGGETEERELGATGMLLWNKMTDPYNEATMGYASDLSRASYRDRGWAGPQFITFMESHDEERLMYKNQRWGADEGEYNARELDTALDRVELASAFFYPIPGPKMLWQFGELGYDFSINYCRNGVVDGCRLDPKPIRWDYLENRGRLGLWSVTSGLIDLKKRYDVFRTADFSLDTGQPLKSIHLNHQDFDVVVLGNFGLTAGEIAPRFQSTGTWYEFFSGESLPVDDPNALILLQPGEKRLYTSQDIGRLVTGTEVVLNTLEDFQVWPNPAAELVTIEIALKQAQELEVALVNAQGQVLRTKALGGLPPGKHQIPLQTPASGGIYFVVLSLESGHSVYRHLVVSP